MVTRGGAASAIGAMAVASAMRCADVVPGVGKEGTPMWLHPYQASELRTRMVTRIAARIRCGHDRVGGEGAEPWAWATYRGQSACRPPRQ